MTAPAPTRHLRRLWPQERVDRLMRRGSAAAAPPQEAVLWQKPAAGFPVASDGLPLSPDLMPGPGEEVEIVTVTITGEPPKRRVWPWGEVTAGLVVISLIVGSLLLLAMTTLFILVFATMGS